MEIVLKRGLKSKSDQGNLPLIFH